MWGMGEMLRKESMHVGGWKCRKCYVAFLKIIFWRDITHKKWKLWQELKPQRQRTCCDWQPFVFLCFKNSSKEEGRNMLCNILFLIGLTHHIETQLGLNRETQNICNQPSLTIIGFPTCWQALKRSTAEIYKKEKLPASRHLAWAHHANFMTTACYCCQFFAFSQRQCIPTKARRIHLL